MFVIFVGKKDFKEIGLFYFFWIFNIFNDFIIGDVGGKKNKIDKISKKKSKNNQNKIIHPKNNFPSHKSKSRTNHYKKIT